MKKILYIIALIMTVVASGCTEYSKVLKSHDVDYKFDYAKRAYDQGKWVQVSTILTDLITPLRGGPKGEEALYLLAMSYYNNKDYMNAGVYYKSYYQRYPKGKYAEDCRFYAGYGYYLDSPDPQLDQSETIQGIKELQGFIDFYPTSDKLEEAKQAMFEMQDKLTLKELQNAQLYYNLGSYLGNNYRSAVIVAENALKTYPYTKYREQLEMLKLKAKYQEARQSVDEKKADRFRDVIDEYYSFINNFPDTKNRSEAENIFKIAKNYVTE